MKDWRENPKRSGWGRVTFLAWNGQTPQGQGHKGQGISDIGAEQRLEVSSINVLSFTSLTLIVHFHVKTCQQTIAASRLLWRRHERVLRKVVFPSEPVLSLQMETFLAVGTT